MKTIGIVGLGLIGGSFARAYKAADETFVVYAAEQDQSTLQFARLLGAIDGELNRETLGKCDGVLVCLHTELSCQWLEANAPFIPASALAMDCCGTKRRICELGFRLARQYGFEYAGGHPMAGTHRWGFKNSRADMFRGASFVVVPRVYDDVTLLERVRSFVMPAGFQRLAVTTAENHDRLIAFTSQLAHVVSNAYVKSPTAREHHGFSAGSYRDLTRVAWLNPTMWTDLFLENRDHLLFEIGQILGELRQYRDAIAAGNEKRLWRLLEEGRRRKEEVDG
ncbi:MAG: prephenate dehydrogenase [Pyramidobacter porci]|uniref:prephenate dehydrogenase n=1 Tax=Pyramidobacter porci TaxID=2605789 RepID=UPI002A755A2D|nr:prephenate dehydrogenase [Pyramidobacter porci]MDY2648410.1 prephenate dehydrogenase [Pyramidobacter porci]